jgi:hypothetical protein
MVTNDNYCSPATHMTDPSKLNLENAVPTSLSTDPKTIGPGRTSAHMAEWMATNCEHIRTLIQNFPRFYHAPPCPAKSMFFFFLWETEDISLWINFCCLTISIADLYISKMVAARVMAGQEGCEKARTCQEIMT